MDALLSQIGGTSQFSLVVTTDGRLIASHYNAGETVNAADGLTPSQLMLTVAAAAARAFRYAASSHSHWAPSNCTHPTTAPS